MIEFLKKKRKKKINLSTANKQTSKLLFSDLTTSSTHTQEKDEKSLWEDNHRKVFSKNLLIEIRDVDGSSDDIISLSHACASIHPPFPLTKALLLHRVKTKPIGNKKKIKKNETAKTIWCPLPVGNRRCRYRRRWLQGGHFRRQGKRSQRWLVWRGREEQTQQPWDWASRKAPGAPSSHACSSPHHLTPRDGIRSCCTGPPHPQARSLTTDGSDDRNLDLWAKTSAGPRLLNLHSQQPPWSTYTQKSKSGILEDGWVHDLRKTRRGISIRCSLQGGGEREIYYRRIVVN